MSKQLPAMSSAAVAKAAAMETAATAYPQEQISTSHEFHAGMYARTIMIPAGVLLTGALINIPTILVLNGDAQVYTEAGPVRYTGHHVLLGAAGRKQVYHAISNTFLTMLFPTSAETVEQAENEFTSEAHKLLSRKQESR